MTAAVLNEEQQIAAGGRLWFKKKRNGQTDIGFTDPFLELVHECWHISPATTESVRENMPLLAVESNEALFSVLSPATGVILYFNDSAMNFPDKLKSEDIICTLGSASERPVPRAQPSIDLDQAQIRPGWTLGAGQRVIISGGGFAIGGVSLDAEIPAVMPTMPPPNRDSHVSEAARLEVLERLQRGQSVRLSTVRRAGISQTLIQRNLLVDDTWEISEEEQG